MGQTKKKGKILATGGGEERDGDVFTILGDNLCLHDIRPHQRPITAAETAHRTPQTIAAPRTRMTPLYLSQS